MKKEFNAQTELNFEPVPQNKADYLKGMEVANKCRKLNLASDKKPIGELVDFLNTKITLSGLYQPAIIKALLNGALTKEELSKAIVGDFKGQFLTHKQYENSKAIRKARSMACPDFLFSKLGVWPRKTLLKHELIQVEKLGKKQIWALNFELPTKAQKELIIAKCNSLLADYIKDQALKNG